jgi:hypothetical protein
MLIGEQNLPFPVFRCTSIERAFASAGSANDNKSALCCDCFLSLSLWYTVVRPEPFDKLRTGYVKRSRRAQN